MAKARSPSYPSIGLSTAIDLVEAIYKKDAQNSITRMRIARHVGYNRITGNTLSMLSSLLRFGLLDGGADDTKVTDLAVLIIASPPGSVVRFTAIRQAAFSPGVYAVIRDRFDSVPVSDADLCAYLLKRKFLPRAVGGVVRVYRETMAFLDEEFRKLNPDGDDRSLNDLAEDAASIRAHATPVPAPRLASRGVDRAPYRVAFNGRGIEIGGLIESTQSAEDLVSAINALKSLLRPPPELNPA